MPEPMIYEEDLRIARAIIGRDSEVTRQYLYRQCWPLFKSIYDCYYTDCDSCLEFINEIYVTLLTPRKATGKCQLENFRGESTLASWLKTVCLFYCYNRFEKKKRSLIVTPIPVFSEENEEASDSFLEKAGSYEADSSLTDRADVETILGMMPNKRYSRLIRLRYLEQKTNEETAKLMGMTMDNYYNKHRLAKAQYEEAYRMEARDG